MISRIMEMYWSHCFYFWTEASTEAGARAGAGGPPGDGVANLIANIKKYFYVK